MRSVKALRGICIAAGLTMSLLLLVMAGTALAAGDQGLRACGGKHGDRDRESGWHVRSGLHKDDDAA